MIKLLGKQHLNRMLALLKDTNKIDADTGKIDIEYGVAYYLLAADEDIFFKARKYVSTHGIKFKDMIAKHHQKLNQGRYLIEYNRYR